MTTTLTLAAIWLAMGAWTAAMLVRGRSARWLWTVGLAVYGVHVIGAYGAFYGWSHVEAWRQTANDTAEVVGVRTGVGLLINHAFGLVLAIDVFSQWGRDRRWAPRWVNGLVVFLMVNGAIVFGEGAVRGYGALLILALALGWAWRCGMGVRERRERRAAPSRD